MLPTTQDYMISVQSRLTKSGHTMKKLAGKLNMPPSVLSEAKHGKRKFTFEKANEIEKAVRELCGE